MASDAARYRVLHGVLDGVESWLSAEAQQVRVLNGMLNLAARVPVLEAAAQAPPPKPDGGGVPKGVEAASVAVVLVKHVDEADRLFRCLTPLMTQLSQALAQMEKAVASSASSSAEGSSPGGVPRKAGAGEEDESWLYGRSLVACFARELWRKQALMQALASRGLPEPCPSTWDLDTLGAVASQWPLSCRHSFTHMDALMEAAGVVRRESLLNTLNGLVAGAS